MDIPAIPTAVVWPHEAYALEGPMDAEREQIIKPVLIGSAARIRAVADKAGLDLGGCTIFSAECGAWNRAALEADPTRWDRHRSH